MSVEVKLLAFLYKLYIHDVHGNRKRMYSLPIYRSIDFAHELSAARTRYRLNITTGISYTYIHQSKQLTIE